MKVHLKALAELLCGRISSFGILVLFYATLQSKEIKVH